MWVIKLGGSLLGQPELPQWLNALTRFGDGKIVIVPGGGLFADAVREAQAETLIADGLAHEMAVMAMDQYAMLMTGLNPDLVIIGLLRVMFDARMTLQQQVSDQLIEHFGDKVFKAIIPRNVRLAEAPSYGLPGVAFDKTSRGAKAYLEFGAEMVERIKHM